MVLGEAMIVAGVGCRRGAKAEDVIAAIDAAASAHALARSAIKVLAVLDNKCDEPGVHAAATLVGCDVTIVGREEAMQHSAATFSVSERSLAATGTSSACETAALAAAGRNARLLGPRVIVGDATCALAVGADVQ